MEKAHTQQQSANNLKFLNHSCLIVESGKTKILCDPWFIGTAFNNGWRLLYENSHNINQIECDYVWISHEHPDHFSIPTLSQINNSKHFLYQQTSDKKVKDWLEKKQQLVTELEDGREFDLGEVKLTSFVSDGYDSVALFKFPNGDKFLNLNDARVELGDTITKIKNHDLSNLKIISIQFSYANWAGNEDDSEIPFHQQDLVIERIVKVYEAFKPEKILLFASYVYFSHEENFFWNKKFWLTYVAEKLAKKGISLIVPKPNQVIKIDEVTNRTFIEENDLAIDFWKKQAQEEEVKDHSNKNISIEEIESAYNEWYDKLWQDNTLSTVSNSNNENFSLRVKIIDKDCVFEISLFNKRLKVGNSNAYDCAVSSETLVFLLKNNFGRGTVTVNGRIQFNYAFAHRFFIFFFIPYANNIGRFFTKEPLTSKILNSIRNTSAMMSIFKFNQMSSVNFEHDLQLFD
jgi:UDP-MurNAc hydroxylase